ncbi:hypothetical protein C8T65DRAFT_739881 [Cerioporus squamosus]|nr:hypothetical protein C8T65DRAFT_741349 [Cerioporus squamosus]KAI0709707.1 hypothetical protein C8T65DRAFT_739881 [Cerioporus squamosus]
MDAEEPKTSPTPVTFVHSPWFLAEYEQPSDLPFPLQTAAHHENISHAFYVFALQHLELVENTYFQVTETKWIYRDQVTYHHIYVGASATLRDNGQWIIEIRDRFELISSHPPPLVFDVQCRKFLLQSWEHTGRADDTPLCPASSPVVDPELVRESAGGYYIETAAGGRQEVVWSFEHEHWEPYHTAPITSSPVIEPQDLDGSAAAEEPENPVVDTPQSEPTILPTTDNVTPPTTPVMSNTMPITDISNKPQWFNINKNYIRRFCLMFELYIRQNAKHYS